MVGYFCPNLTEIPRVQSALGASGLIQYFGARYDLLNCSVVALNESSDKNCHFGVNCSLWNEKIQITTLN